MYRQLIIWICKYSCLLKEKKFTPAVFKVLFTMDGVPRTQRHFSEEQDSDFLFLNENDFYFITILG